MPNEQNLPYWVLYAPFSVAINYLEAKKVIEIYQVEDRENQSICIRPGELQTLIDALLTAKKEFKIKERKQPQKDADLLAAWKCVSKTNTFGIKYSYDSGYEEIIISKAKRSLTIAPDHLQYLINAVEEAEETFYLIHDLT